MNKIPSLGKGLAALLGETTLQTQQNPQNIDIALIVNVLESSLYLYFEIILNNPSLIETLDTELMFSIVNNVPSVEVVSAESLILAIVFS